MAAGVALPVARVPEFRNRLHAAVCARVDVTTLRQKLYIDGLLTLRDISPKLMREISLLEPFGAANKEPLFYIPDLSLVEPPQLLKDAHVKCKVFADGILKACYHV